MPCGCTPPGAVNRFPLSENSWKPTWSTSLHAPASFVAARVTITVSGRVNRELYYNLPWTKTNPVYEVPMLESSLIDTEIMTLQARDPADQDSILTRYEEVEGSDPGDYFRIITKTDSRGVTPGQFLCETGRALTCRHTPCKHCVPVHCISFAQECTNTTDKHMPPMLCLDLSVSVDCLSLCLSLCCSWWCCIQNCQPTFCSWFTDLCFDRCGIFYTIRFKMVYVHLKLEEWPSFVIDGMSESKN